MTGKHLVYYIFLLVIGSPVGRCERRLRNKEAGKYEVLNTQFPARVYNLMMEHYEDVLRKIGFIRYIRFTYEESPQYEMGYIMGEIIERYRKMVEHLKRPVMYKSDAVFDTIKRVDLIQKLYFEVYHLVNMMHEIPRKYGILEEDGTKGPTTTDAAAAAAHSERVREAQERLLKNKQQRETNKKKKLKDMKLWRELMLKYQNFTVTTKKPKNAWWPIDYGWEIDYFWLKVLKRTYEYR